MIGLEAVTLEGHRVRLEPLALEHRDGLEKAAADGELWHLFFTFVPEPSSLVLMLGGLPFIAARSRTKL